ncbi:MAG TPA: TonB-dependent receptor [Sphingomonadaceae bacterium]|nr:TonB-dependent receptor [Sphingomonadaceae bacterium]
MKTGASLVAVSSLLVSATAFAQDDAADDEETIVVTGIRASLANSQDIKRESETVVDAITAEDIGALPDRSVTEALQRVPGVAINRFAGSNDPDHFSVEGSGVVVRGLNFVRGEFNGRDTFSANGGRQLGFSDVPPELMGSVIVAKNLTADMIEGGLAGTVNLNVRKPFDNYGFHWGFTAEANYGDLAKEWTPNVSGMISNTWETEGGVFGILVGASYSQVMSQAHGIQIANFQPRDGVTTQGSNNSGPVTRTLLTDANGMTIGGPGNPYYAPLGGQFRIQEFDRERMGIAGALQYENHSKTVEASLQYFRAETSNAWGERTYEAAPDLSEYNTFPAPGTGYDFDENNVFENGYITLPGAGWRSGDTGTSDPRAPIGGMQMSLARREVYQETMNQDFGFNLKLTPNERWAFNFDAQYTEATTDNLDVSVFGSTFADQMIDLRGDLPQITNVKPLNTVATWAGAGASPLATSSNEEFLTSPLFTFWRAAMDHIEQSDGDQWAFRGDAQYNFGDDSFLKRLKVGGRWSNREQTVRYTTYNWGRLSEVWGGNSGGAVYFDEFGGDRTEFYDFPNFFGGNAAGPLGGWYYNGDLINDYEGSADFFYDVDDFYREGQTGPAGGNRGWFRLSDRAGVISGTPFLPSDIQVVGEETWAAYAMLSFGNDQYGDYPLFSGNVGLRYVDTSLESLGSVAFPSPNLHGNGETYEERCFAPEPDPNNPNPPAFDPPAICDGGEAEYYNRADFANGGSIVDNAINNYDNWMPSLNLKLELNEETQIRFAYSRAIARPDFRYGRNFVTIGGGEEGGGFVFTARAGNPRLKPAQADQFDLSFEWYFDDVGSLTLTGFYKSVQDFFYDDVNIVTYTNNGQTYDVRVSGPANYTEENGSIKGFELAYQQTWEFLPSPFDGLGFSGNYTYIDSEGVPNSQIGGIENAGQASNLDASGRLPLEQLSKHNFNATLFYEKGPLSMRASYNWRSRFLLTTRDVIFPYYPIYNDETGQLDASIFYSITPNIKLAIQATNLTNEVTKTLQQIDEDGLLAPRSFFMNDRRYSFGVRASF